MFSLFCFVFSQYGCARTKTTAILEVVAGDSIEQTATFLQTHPYSMATDGSTDYDAVKLYPILVRYFDESGRVFCVILALKELKKESTGENIYLLIESELESRGIPLKNMMSFAMDNANVMSGMKKGVAGFLSRNHPNVYISGCLCHLMHLAAEKGGAKLQESMATSIEDALIMIYYYLDKSSNRKHKLEELQGAANVKAHKILKLVQTRWLALHECVKRLIEQWSPLSMFYKSELEMHMGKLLCNIFHTEYITMHLILCY